MKVKLKATTALAAFLLAPLAFAQGPVSLREGGPGFGRQLGFGLHPGKLVVDAPYYATATEQLNLVLQDGSTIQRSRTAQVARDSRGRTYSTATLNGALQSGGTPKTLVFIADPVAGYSYVIDTAQATVVRRPLQTHQPPNGEGPGWDRASRSESTADVVVNASTGVFNGLKVDIKTTTRTIPAGKIGNSAPLVATNTVQISSALQIVVSAVRSDPVRGNSSYTLSNIVTQEPPASLFAIPTGYTVTDAPAAFHGSAERHRFTPQQ
jgi:hypothetical protein